MATVEMITVRGFTGEDVQVKANDKRVYNGQLFPNATRAGDAKAHHETQLALAKYKAGGGEVTVVDGKKKGRERTAPPPIETGDKKYDMYLNALPHPVRLVVIDKKLDPRELYKEYRSLKKEGLMAKYCPQQSAA